MSIFTSIIFIHMLGYITEEQQNAFNLLPKEQQDILFNYAWKTAHSMEHAMNWPKTIEIAGKTILAMPLESMGMTDEQKKKFETAWGLMKPSIGVSILDENQEKMMYWAESFEKMTAKIKWQTYTGFALFHKVYEAFPEVLALSEEQARAEWLYPIIHFRNHAARVWMAKNLGGHLATLDENHAGELMDIHQAAKAKAIEKHGKDVRNPTILKYMGQVMLGWRVAKVAKVYGLGHVSCLASGSLNVNGDVRSFYAVRDKSNVRNYWDLLRTAISSVVVMDTSVPA